MRSAAMAQVEEEGSLINSSKRQSFDAERAEHTYLLDARASADGSSGNLKIPNLQEKLLDPSEQDDDIEA